MTTTSVTLSGFVYDNAGNAVQDATVTAYTSADNATSAISGLTDTTDANGRWDLTTTDETKYPMDVKIVFGSSTRWIKAGNGINVTRLTVSGAAVFGEDDTGVDVTMYGATSGRYLLWDESEDALHLNDSTELKIGSLAAGDMILYHDGTNSYITNATGALKIATETSGIAVTIGHGTSEVTVADNLTVTGDLTVSGTTTTVDTTNTVVKDSLIELNTGASSNSNDLGIVMERGSTGDNAIIAWDESADVFTVGTTTATGASTGNLTITAAAFTAGAISGTTGTFSTDVSVGDDLSLTSDSAVFNMGDGSDFTITHDGTTGATIAATPLTVTSATAATWSTSAGALTLNGTGGLVLQEGGAAIIGISDARVIATTNTASVDLDASGAIQINSSGGALSIGNDNIDQTVNIATAGTRTLNIGIGDGTDVTTTIVKGTLSVGVDDTGYDVKFFGASAGAYMLYDQSEDQLVVMGKSADATDSTGKLLLATSLTDVNANDVIGKIDFQAPHEAGGTDAITVAASIQAIAQGTFAADLNATDLIFYTGHSEAATEKFRFTSQGEIGVGGANYGSSGDVLTSGGAGAAPTWETPTTGDITGVTAGDGLTGGGSSGGVSLALDLVSNGGLEIQSAEVSVAQGISQYDVAQFAASVADNDFLRIDGTAVEGLSASEVAAAIESSIDAVGALDSGSITSGFGTIDTGSSTITTTGSLQIQTIDYTDGDLAMTIADGGGVTFAQDATFSGDVALADDKVINLGEAGKIDFGDESPDDNEATGVVFSFLAGATLAIGDVVYMGTDGEVLKADADAVTSMPAIGICVGAGTDGNAVDVLVQGIMHDTSAFDTFTVGADIFVSTTAGAVTATAPSGSGDTVQKVGVALHADMVYFNFNTTEVLLA